MSAPGSLASAEGVCRSCGAWPVLGPACPDCGSARILRHAELATLAIVHVDCDAFYAAVEKRDDPSLLARPLIVGGGKRGVVSTCCYVARQFGVRSAMPMFKALRLCPEAVVLKPDMAKYKAVSRQLGAMMEALTPLVEPLSIDEAFLDMRGTERLHGAPASVTMARFALKVRQDIGITVSVGLAPNKFLAKLASDLDKPGGMTLIGGAEARDRIAPLPVSRLWGVGPAAERRLHKRGFRTFGDLAGAPERLLLADLGPEGLRLQALARGEDDRRIKPERARKSVSSETTFDIDIADPDRLAGTLRRLANRVAATLRAQGHWAAGVTLKLKTADFRTRTRSHALPRPVQTAHALIQAALPLLAAEADGTAFRLLGIGVVVCPPPERHADLALEPDLEEKHHKLEVALDRLRARFGKDIVG